MVKCSHHGRAHISRQQGKHVGTRNSMTKCLTFCGKEGVELKGRDVIALKESPGVPVGISGIHPPNVI
jgi:hypothetical protein